MIIYFFAVMQKKYLGYVSKDITIRLKQRLTTEYWKERFEYFGLTLEHLEKENFPSHIKSGGIPNHYSGDLDRFYFPKHPIN